jgi:hypothetical protein
MWSVYNTDIFMTINVKSLHKRYDLEQPYALYFDQPHLTFDQAWYTGPKANKTAKLLTGKLTSCFYNI